MEQDIGQLFGKKQRVGGEVEEEGEGGRRQWRMLSESVISPLLIFWMVVALAGFIAGLVLLFFGLRDKDKYDHSLILWGSVAVGGGLLLLTLCLLLSFRVPAPDSLYAGARVRVTSVRSVRCR